MSRRRKIILMIGLAVILITVSLATILISSALAVSNFRGSASQQLNSVISENKTATVSPVKLAAWPLADILNPAYRRVKMTQPTYQKLLNDARNYNVMKKCQNDLTTLYNLHANDDAPLTGNALNVAETCSAVVKNNYPTAQNIKNDLQQLTQAITSSTTFSQIETSLSTVINDQTTWLNQIETKLNADLARFQKSVN
ncbi:MAG: hypothetical protein WAW91_02855 [Candidatus Nanoperiomorbaceae bacterium]